MISRPKIPPTDSYGYFACAHLLEHVYALCACLAAGGLCSRGVLRVSRLMAAAGRVLIYARRYNDRLSLRRSMLGDASWRGRVARELGGEAGFSRWDKNNVAAQFRINEALPDRPARSRRIKADICHDNVVQERVKTDFSGQFRLAPIARRSAARNRVEFGSGSGSSSGLGTGCGGKAKCFTRGFEPISLWPDELRGGKARGCAGILGRARPVLHWPECDGLGRIIGPPPVARGRYPPR